MNNGTNKTDSNDMEHKLFIQYDCNLQEAKNKDYGNAYANDLEKYGLIAANIMIDHKLSRLTRLLDNKQKVTEESPFETWIDLVNYCVMTINYIKSERPELSIGDANFKAMLVLLQPECGHKAPVQHCQVLAYKSLMMHKHAQFTDLSASQCQDIIKYVIAVAEVALAECLAFDESVLHKQYLPNG